MILLTYIVLFAWMPIVLLLFAIVPPHRAVIVAYVVGWLYLPLVSFPLQGLPDFDKVMATNLGALFGALVFDTNRLLNYRPRWFDLPAASWILTPIVSALVNGVPLYEACSFSLKSTIFWVVPYLLGRVYFDTPARLRDLGIGVVVGGLSYGPLCVFESRFGTNLNLFIYGFHTTYWEGYRYGGYRPRVFLLSGLECGMWFCLVTLMATWCWTRGTIKAMAGQPFWLTVAFVAFIALMCRATGALVLLMSGIGMLWLARQSRSAWPIWVLLLLAPTYMTTRALGLWTGSSLVAISAATVGTDRAESLDYRLRNETQLLIKGNQKPILGWGLGGRGLVYDDSGQMVFVVDGMWIVIYGQIGAVGLFTLYAMWGLPVALMLVRNPVQRWSDPDLAPAAAFATFLCLYSIDCLFNGMFSPIYMVISGGISSLPKIPSPVQQTSAVILRCVAGDRLAEAGMADEAIVAYRGAIAIAPRFLSNAVSYRDLAEAHGRLADILESTYGEAEAEADRWADVDLRDAIAAGPDALPQDHRDLGNALDALARVLAHRGREAEAAEARRRSVAEFAELASTHVEDRERWASALNDLAWLLATADDLATRNPDQAALMAERATLEFPTTGPFWNTLGVASYRLGDDRAAVAALERSITLGPPGGTAFDLLFLAMARARLDDDPGAVDALVRGVAWAERHRPDHPGLVRFRREAEAMIGGTADHWTTADQT